MLVDGCADGAAFSRLVESLVEAGVRMLQIRDKRLATPALVDRVGRALAIARRRPPEEAVFVIVNDRVDVAAAVGAAGAHVGEDDLPVPWLTVYADEDEPGSDDEMLLEPPERSQRTIGTRGA